MTPLLVDAVVKVTCILAAALGAVALLRARAAALRHWVLAVAIVGAAVAPVASTVLPGWRVELGWLAADAVADTGQLQVVSVDPPQPQSISALPAVRIDDVGEPASIAAVVAWLWLGGAGAFLLVLAIGWGRLAWLASQCRRVTDGRLPTVASEIAQTYGIARAVLLLESDHPTLLATWGMWRPRIVVPASAGHWSDDRVRTVLAHELAHVARHDWGIQMLAEVVRSIHWFNPLAWLACRRLRHESERTCDDFVLRSGVDGGDYATHLIALTRQFGRARRLPLPALAMARPSGLERRVLAMVNARLDHGVTSRRVRLVALVAVAAMALSILAAETAPAGSDATLSGYVYDEMDLPVPGVKVTASDEATSKKYEATTNEDGLFEFVAVPDGEYTVSTSYPGLKTSVVSDVTAEGGEATELEITMEIGELSETVIVEGAPGGSAGSRSSSVARATPTDWSGYVARCTMTQPGGNVVAPRKERDMPPRYPRHLVEEGVQGKVVVEGIVSTDGLVKNVTVLQQPHPALADAALEAVSQWAYRPTLLNCKPVDVFVTVTVNFRIRE